MSVVEVAAALYIASAVLGVSLFALATVTLLHLYFSGR